MTDTPVIETPEPAVKPLPRLSDFYTLSEDLTFSFGEHDVTVSVVKLNDLEDEETITAANSAKAKVLLRRTRDPDSDENVDDLAYLSGLTSRALAQFICREEIERLRRTKASEALHSEEFKDSNLEAIINDWDSVLDNPNSPESQAAMELVDKFNKKVAEELSAAIEEELAIHEDREHDELVQAALKAHIEWDATEAWAAERSIQLVYHATRIPNPDELPTRLPRYFETVTEVRETPKQIRDKILDTLGALTVDPLEGKERPAGPASSTPSGSPAPAEDSPGSGPEDANA